MKRLLTLLVAGVLMFSSFALSACENGDPIAETGPDTISLLKNVKIEDEWVDSNYISLDPENSNRGLKSFTLSSDENALSEILVNKYNSNDALIKSVGKYDLKDFKKIVITAKGFGDFVLKVESNPIIPGGVGYPEILFELTETEQTFEFNLSFETYGAIRAGLKRIFLYPHYGRKGAQQKISISKLEFSKEKPDPEKVLNYEATQIETPNHYDGSGDIFNINKNFGSNDGAYVIEWNSGVSIITLTAKKQPWSYVKSSVSGNIKDFTKLYIKYKGSAGTSFKVKLESVFTTHYETKTPPHDTIPDPQCDGTEQEYTLEGFSAEHLTHGPTMWIVIFFEPGKSGGAGTQFELINLEFRK